VLRRLNSPRKIQQFLHDLGQNFESEGDTCRPVRVVLRHAHRALHRGGDAGRRQRYGSRAKPPLPDGHARDRDFDTSSRCSGAIGHWGAISKTNGIGLRCRDPVYRRCAKLAIFLPARVHQQARGQDAARYSRPFRLRGFDPKVWVTGEKRLGRGRAARRHPPLSAACAAASSTPCWPRDPFERRVGRDAAVPAPKALLEKLARQKRRRK